MRMYCECIANFPLGVESQYSQYCEFSSWCGVFEGFRYQECIANFPLGVESSKDLGTRRMMNIRETTRGDVDSDVCRRCLEQMRGLSIRRKL